VCRDCSHTWKCPNCDVALTLHTSPKTQLLCHHCHTTVPIPEICPKCSGVHIQGVGIALQTIEMFLKQEFPHSTISRLDSDQKQVETTTDIYVTTEYALRNLSVPIDVALILLPESELNIPEFDIEERVYAHIRAVGSQAKECIIETHTPRLPLIQDILHGNYKSFFTRILAERKQFHYPPYSGLAYITLSHKNTSILEEMGAKIQNKLDLRLREIQKEAPSPSQSETDFIRYDRSIRMKRAGVYVDTIVVRSDSIDALLEPIR
jgi:primosomal protein N' (replication factor Y)